MNNRLHWLYFFLLILAVELVSAQGDCINFPNSTIVSTCPLEFLRTTYVYCIGTGTATFGSTTVAVTIPDSVGGYSNPFAMIIQMQGASIEESIDTGLYGNVDDFNGVGKYQFLELTTVTSPNGNQDDEYSINFKQPLLSTYSGKFQVILMYVCDIVEITESFTIPSWNGETGGVFPIIADELRYTSGSIIASGTGYRGGVYSAVSIIASTEGEVYAKECSVGVTDAEKGEGIAGQPTFGGAQESSYPNNFACAFGAPANAGGGLNNDDPVIGGGGGGGNGGAGATGESDLDLGGIGGREIGNDEDLFLGKFPIYFESNIINLIFRWWRWSWFNK